VRSYACLRVRNPPAIQCAAGAAGRVVEIHGFGRLACDWNPGFARLCASLPVHTDTGAAVSLVDLGQNGWTSADLLQALRNDSALRSTVAAAQVVTWNIGGNDLLHATRLFYANSCRGSDNLQCFRQAVATFVENWDAVVAEILSLRSSSTTILRTMDVYNPFVGQQLADGTFPVLNPFLEAVNAHIMASATLNHIGWHAFTMHSTVPVATNGREVLPFQPSPRPELRQEAPLHRSDPSTNLHPSDFATRSGLHCPCAACYCHSTVESC